MTLLDDAWDKLRSKPEPYIFGAPKIVPEPKPEPSIPLFELTPELIDAATLKERDAIIADLEKWGLLRLPFDCIALKFPHEKIAEVLGWTTFPEYRHVYLTMAIRGEPLKVETIYVSKYTEDPDRSSPTYAEKELPTRLAAGITFPRQVVTPAYVSGNVLVEKRSQLNAIDVNKAEKRRAGTAADFHAMAAEALTILLASLAARNVVKDVRYNGRAGAGANSKPIYLGGGGVTYLSRTIVRPPRIVDVKEIDPEHPPRTGLAKLLLVRGFIRNQVADTTKPQPPDVHVTVVGAGRTGRREQWIAPYYRGVDPDYVPAHHYVVRP